MPGGRFVFLADPLDDGLDLRGQFRGHAVEAGGLEGVVPAGKEGGAFRVGLGGERGAEGRDELRESRLDLGAVHALVGVGDGGAQIVGDRFEPRRVLNLGGQRTDGVKVAVLERGVERRGQFLEPRPFKHADVLFPECAAESSPPVGG